MPQNDFEVFVFGKIFHEKIPVVRAEINEGISEIFSAQVFLRLEKNLKLNEIIDSQVTLEIKYDTVNSRFFCGIVELASIENISNLIRQRSENILYIKIVPYFSKTILTKKYRTFQNLSPAEIIDQILRENKIPKYKINLKNLGKEKREFCVQYNESDYHFISRLLEESGAFFYFDYEKDSSDFVISDMSVSAAKIKNPLKQSQVQLDAYLQTDIVFNLSLSNTMGIQKIDSFSYNENNTEIINSSSSLKQSSLNIGEKEFYDRVFLEKQNGDIISKFILESENATLIKLNAQSFYPKLASGSAIEIKNSLYKEQNDEYFIICVKHIINQIDFDNKTPIYQNSFTAIPLDVPYRPIPIHLKTRINGCQTATVTGSESEEIYCDAFGRIKVKFHWDSRIKKNENSSCWIRVSRSWAGRSFGEFVVPRVGMEVVVDFINGDPDQPIVTGCLYNGINIPPKDYATQKTVSSFYSNSTKSEKGEGPGFNEIKIEDKFGMEEIFIHAQKDIRTKTEDSVYHNILGSKITIFESEKDNVSNNLVIKKGQNNVTINEGDYNLNLDKGNQKIQLKEGNFDMAFLNGNMTITLKDGQNENLKIILQKNGDVLIDSKGNINIKSEKNIQFDSKGDFLINTKGSLKINGTKDISINSQKMTLNSKSSLEISATQAKISAKAAIEFDSKMQFKISAAMIEIMGKGSTKIGASGVMAISGAQISLG